MKLLNIEVERIFTIKLSLSLLAYHFRDYHPSRRRNFSPFLWQYVSLVTSLDLDASPQTFPLSSRDSRCRRPDIILCRPRQNLQFRLQGQCRLAVSIFWEENTGWGGNTIGGGHGEFSCAVRCKAHCTRRHACLAQTPQDSDATPERASGPRSASFSIRQRLPVKSRGR